MRSYILALVFISFSMVAFAQPGDPSGNPTVPITGIEFLIAAGAGFGIKKILGKSRHK